MQGCGDLLQDVDDGDEVIAFPLDFRQTGAEPRQFIRVSGAVSWRAEALRILLALLRCRRARPLLLHSRMCAR